MALANLHGVGLSQYATFYPPPLQIQKKPRRATFHRRLLRRPTHAQHHTDPDHGPLDDIIDEIKGGIWASPPDYCTDSSVFDWTDPLRVPSTWTSTPLPISRIPSGQPLMVRKNRQSHSSTSGSSGGDSMALSRHTSGMNSDPVSSLLPLHACDCSQAASRACAAQTLAAVVLPCRPHHPLPLKICSLATKLSRRMRGTMLARESSKHL
jgi:hypothetical protein